MNDLTNFYRVVEGDSLKVLPLLPSESVDLVVTDPPYNVGKNFNNESDNQTEQEYETFLCDFLIQAKRILKGDGKLLCFLAIGHLNKTYKIFDEHLIYKWTLCHYAINKRARSKIGYNLWQPILLYVKDEKTNVFSLKQDVYKFTTGQEFFDHPTPKPIELIEKLIKDFSEENDVILDPFLGSGTTVFACRNLNRSCIGVEIEPKYCQLSLKRCQSEAPLGESVLYQYQRLVDGKLVDVSSEQHDNREW